MKVLRGIIYVFNFISMAATLIMLAITVVDVIMRLAFKAPIAGVVELSQILLVCIMACMAGVILEKRNIDVDVVINAFPKKVGLTIDIVTLLLTVAYFIVVGWQTLWAVKFSMDFHVVYSMLRVPEWPFLALLGLSFLVAAMATVMHLVERIKNRNVEVKKDKTDVSSNPELEILSMMDEEEGGH